MAQKFSVGNKVVAMNTGRMHTADGRRLKDVSNLISVGKVYTVKHVDPSAGEIVLKGVDSSFDPQRFRLYDVGMEAVCTHDVADISYNGMPIATIERQAQPEFYVWSLETNANKNRGITKGKKYLVTEVDEVRSTYKIITDFGTSKWLKSSRFSSSAPVTALKRVTCSTRQEKEGFHIGSLEIGDVCEITSEGTYRDTYNIRRVRDGYTNIYHKSIFSEVWYEYTDAFGHATKLLANKDGSVSWNFKTVKPIGPSFVRI